MSDTAIIHGTGLVGASVGLALRARGWHVSGWDPDGGRLGEAKRRGAIDDILGSATDRLDDADLVVLAAPPSEVALTLMSLTTTSLVTDVAGVKGPIVDAASGLSRFVGGHPMAGGTTVGPTLASSTLFHGATWVLTSDGAEEDDIERLAEITRSLGANPMVMTAEAHDRSVALVSHLPHLLAGALLEIAGEDASALALVGGGFRDLTRVAGARSSWWGELLTVNSSYLLEAVESLELRLAVWKDLLARNDATTVESQLESVRRIRSDLDETHVQVGVVLLDEPGEIARVGRALEESKVDVRDFQLRHGEHGGGGILTITVAAEGEEDLRSAIRTQGFVLQS